MDRRTFIAHVGRAALAGAAAMTTPRAGAAQEGVARRPNIVLILADDLGYGDLGYMGNPRIRTPHLDALAAEGVRFPDFHSSGAVCSPTRAGLLTGRYQQRAGIPMVISAARHRHVGLDPGEATFAERLQAAGYATALFGKWHLGYLPKFNPVHQGFDAFRGYVSGNVDYFSHVDQTGRADWWHGDRLEPEEGYVTHLVTRHAVRFIEEHREGPFCLYVAHEAPHYPYQGPGDEADRAVGGKFPVRGSRRDKAAAYKEMVEAMDASVGQVVAALRRLGLDRQTFVFFFSDNGATPPGSNAPLRGRKGTLWEGGHRVPAIAWWPGRVPAGGVCEEPTLCLDLFPTFIELAGATVPRGLKLDGVSLAPLLLEGERLGPRTLFWGHGRQRAVRRGRWKLLLGTGGKGDEPRLFDLAESLEEKHDVAPDSPRRVESLLAALEAWEEDVGPSTDSSRE
ncbi:MAG: sulfatase-like hydrolase/transferase [Candidatus Brocadiia bacterium]